MRPGIDGAAKIRVPALTGLRFVAALMVFVSHTGLPTISPGWVRQIAMSGKTGVTLFFVLSGFVLAINYFDVLKHPSPRNIWNFAVARVARIWPLYLTVLGYVFWRYWRADMPLHDWTSHVFAIQAWSANLFKAFDFNGPGWSISVEFFLYACFPVVVVILARVKTTRALLVAIAATLTILLVITLWFVVTGRGGLSQLDGGSSHRWLYRSPLLRVFDLTLGVLIARLLVSLRGDERVQRVGGWMSAVGAAVMITLMSIHALFDTTFSFDTAYVVPVLLIIFGLSVAPTSLGARALSSRALVMLGEISFAFYLVHAQVLNWLDSGTWGDSIIGQFGYLGLKLVVSVAAALALHKLVEGPAQRWLRSRLSVRQAGTKPACSTLSSGPADVEDVPVPVVR